MSREEKTDVTLHARCVLKGEGIHGIISFQQNSKGGITHANGKITGASRGKHGLAVHAYGDLSKGLDSIGEHFNPLGRSHGAPDAAEKHIGDLGNVEAKEDGTVAVDLKSNHISLLWDNACIVGRTLVLYENEDDLGRGNDETSRTTGHAGKPIAFGVIGIAPP